MACNELKWGLLAVLGSLCVTLWPASVQAQAGIYSCVDAKGRRLTADRPIPECLDRPQRELNPSGTVRRTIEPSLTGPERAAKAEREKEAAEQQAREAEQRRRDRALLIRYPNEASHDKALAEAVAVFDAAAAAAQKRLQQLQAQEKGFAHELEFYKGDPSKVPPALTRRVETNRQHQQEQTRFIDKQMREKQRITERFRQEREKLQPLWTGGQPASATAAR